MTHYPFAYTVLLSEEDEKNKYKKESGLGICSSFTHAMELIENYYSVDLIAVKDLELFEESPVMPMPHEFVQNYKNTVFADYAIPCDSNGN